MCLGGVTPPFALDIDGLDIDGSDNVCKKVLFTSEFLKQSPLSPQIFPRKWVFDETF